MPRATKATKVVSTTMPSSTIARELHQSRMSPWSSSTWSDTTNANSSRKPRQSARSGRGGTLGK